MGEPSKGIKPHLGRFDMWQGIKLQQESLTWARASDLTGTVLHLAGHQTSMGKSDLWQDTKPWWKNLTSGRASNLIGKVGLVGM
jgi:hypothetical protein